MSYTILGKRKYPDYSNEQQDEQQELSNSQQIMLMLNQLNYNLYNIKQDIQLKFNQINFRIDNIDKKINNLQNNETIYNDYSSSYIG